MTEVTQTTYARTQDKYGLLQRHRTQTLNHIVNELEMLLADSSAYSLLDCACGDGLYTAELAKWGRNISAADESKDAGKLLKKRLAGQGVSVPFRQADIFSLEQAYPEKFDAILCLNGELARYEDTEAALQALFSRLDENGILVLGIPDMEDLPREMDGNDYYGKDTFAPLLLGVEHEGKKYTVIQNRRHDVVMEWVVINTIYHIEDPTTGAVTVDWEEAKHSLLPVEYFYGLEEFNEWYVHKDVKVGGERLIVIGLQPPREYMGPKSFFGDSDDQQSC